MNLKLSVVDQLPIHAGGDDLASAALASMICGTGQACREKLEQLSSHYGVEEISVVVVTHEFEARIHSYELLATACEMTSATMPLHSPA